MKKTTETRNRSKRSKCTSVRKPRLATKNRVEESDLQFEPGDGVCIVLPSGKTKFGTLVRTIEDEDKAVVQLSESDRRVRVKLKYVKPDSDAADEESAQISDDFESEGFTQYDVVWDKNYINFKLKSETTLFYGWWRKISDEAFAIDLHCQYEGKEYNCEVLYYTEDPRESIESLNADLCAAVNKWFYNKCRGSMETIKSLELKASKPVIHINSIETIDRILIELKDYRDTAIRSGGLYTYMFSGDKEGDPSMRIVLDLSVQAKGLEGRVPSLYTGAILDQSTQINQSPRKGKKRRVEISEGMNNASINSILEKLKSTTDKAQQRKYRSILRKLGHRGGTRQSKSA